MSSDVHAKWMNSEACDEGRKILRATLDEVLDGLDVVIRLGLDRLDLGAVLDAEVTDQLSQAGFGVARQARQLGQAEHREVEQPLDFNAQALAHEGKFGEHFPELGRLPAIAAVQRRQGGEGKELERHGKSGNAACSAVNACGPHR